MLYRLLIGVTGTGTDRDLYMTGWTDGWTSSFTDCSQLQKKLDFDFFLTKQKMN